MMTTAILFLAFFKLIVAAPFKNCNDSIPIQMYFTFPDPLVVTLGEPIKVVAGASVKVEIPLKLKVKHLMWKKVFGSWLKLPCLDRYGSCIEPMLCEEFIAMGFNGTCPIKKGEYRNYHVEAPTPKFPVPAFLTNGFYRIHIEGYTNDMKDLLFCGGVTQYIKQGKKLNLAQKLLQVFIDGHS